MYVHEGAILESGDKFQNVTFAAGANCGAAEGAGFANTGDKDSPIITRVSAYLGSGVGYINSQTVTNLYCHGNLDITEGGVVSGGVFGQGSTWVSSGGFVDSVSLTSGANVDISNAGSANKLTIGDGALVYVGGNGLASNTEVLAGGTLVAYYGTADGIYVHAGAILESGDKFQNVTFAAGANCGAAEGAGFANTGDKDSPIITKVSAYLGSGVGYIYGQTAADLHCKGNLNVFEGGVVSGGVFGQGSTWVYSGGFVDSVSLTSGAYVEVTNSAAANKLTIGDGALVYIGGSGVASNTEVLSGGSLTAYYGTAEGVYVHAGAILESGDKFQNVIFEAGADCGHAEGAGFGNISDKDSPIITRVSAYLGSGVGYIYGQTVEDLHCKGNLYISEGGVISGGEFTNGYVTISSGGTAAGVTAHNGAIVLLESGTIDDFTVGEGGSVYVNGGGVATDVEVLAGGSMVAYYGTAEGVYVHSGAILESGDKFQNVIFEAGADCGHAEGAGFGNISDKDSPIITRVSTYLGSGVGYIYGQTVEDLHCKGNLYISEGGVVSGGEFTNGYVTISSGGTAVGVTAHNGAIVQLESGTIDDFTVGEGGSVYVNGGGVATDVEVLAGGSMVAYYGSATGVLVHSGSYLDSGVNFYQVTFEAGANCGAAEGAGFVNLGETNQTITQISAYAGSGVGYLYGQTMSGLYAGGVLCAYDGGVIDGGHLAAGATWNISSGGIAKDVLVDEGAYLYVYGSGCLEGSYNVNGSMWVGNGGEVAIWNPSTVGATGKLTMSGTWNFVVASATAGNAALIENYAKANGGKYSITVSDLQKRGDYKLIGNASAFNSSVTITVAETGASDIFVWHQNNNGIGGSYNKIVFDDRKYTLWGDTATGALTLTVVAPPVITLEGDNTTPLQSSTLTAVTDDGSPMLYSLDQETWTEYEDVITVTANGTYYFKSTNSEGLVGTAEYTFTNIDRIPPVITLTGDNQKPLQSSTVSATDDDGSPIFYSLDNKTWTAYEDTITVTENATYYFKATDAAGNVGTAEITFANIDTVPPVITVTGDNTTPLQSSTVTAVTDDGSPIYYSLDNEAWTPYEDTITVTANATYYFKATDAAGNVGTAEFTFANIDTVPPAITVSGDNKTWLQASTLTASTDDGSPIQYSTDNQTWIDYEGTISVTANATYYLQAIDAAGNVGTAEFVFGNIDTVAPTAPAALDAAVKDLTVTLTWDASTDNLSGVKEYVVTYSHDGEVFSVTTADTSFVIEKAAAATWQWNVKAIDNAGNVSAVADGEDFVVVKPDVQFVPGSDIDGNGISDVLFHWTGGDYQVGFWMNGTADWQGQGRARASEWVILGSYDMNADGKADMIMAGKDSFLDMTGTYLGYYDGSIDTDANWHTIGFLVNTNTWVNAVGNLTGTTGKNSIVWYSPELYALGAWSDGAESWTSISNSFGGGDWTLVGCGDFDGDGKDSVVMSGMGGQFFYAADLDGTVTSLGSANWNGWEIRAIGDFSGDGKDDMVAFHNDTGSMVMFANGCVDDFTSIGQLDAKDWFVVGAGDYNGDQQDDLLVRQYSTGMLGYYISGDTSQWVEMGRGVDMNWTVIA